MDVLGYTSKISELLSPQRPEMMGHERRSVSWSNAFDGSSVFLSSSSVTHLDLREPVVFICIRSDSTSRIAQVELRKMKCMCYSTLRQIVYSCVASHLDSSSFVCPPNSADR